MPQQLTILVSAQRLFALPRVCTKSSYGVGPTHDSFRHSKLPVVILRPKMAWPITTQYSTFAIHIITPSQRVIATVHLVNEGSWCLLMPLQIRMACPMKNFTLLLLLMIFVKLDSYWIEKTNFSELITSATWS